MVKLLERIAEKSNSINPSGKKRDGVSKDNYYSTFAEMYLEKPILIQAGLTASVCTWRGVPTIDDW